jgi:deoxyribodipyrimidine photo-lyase
MSDPQSSSVPAIRVSSSGDGSVRANGEFVLYWMTTNRRPRWNFSLQRAVDWARDLSKPLVVLEALRSDYLWACDRFHRFVIEGMQANAAAFADKATYHPYVEPVPAAGSGLVRHLAERACVVVTDDFPCFFIPRMIEAAARQCPVRFEVVDSNGLLPMKTAYRCFPTAYAYRRFLQRELPRHLDDAPKVDPLRGAAIPKLSRLPRAIRQRWPRVTQRALEGGRPAADRLISRLPVDHSVRTVELGGGYRSAGSAVKVFLTRRLDRYDEGRNQPEETVSSGLSPYLHFGHVASHEIFHQLARQEGWYPGMLSQSTAGTRSGWWGLSASAEAFLDQLVTWRELGYNGCLHRSDYDRFESLPPWALETLRVHAIDAREFVYSLEEFERAATHDDLWNAAQNELVREGRIHNYLRMLWGKKILEWTRTPREALEIMIELNNKYALDGRNPNSYSGIFWVLGRYDRAWGPERQIFGKVRYMSSVNTARKVRVRDYIAKYS